MDKFDNAIESARQVLRLMPDKAESHIAYANAVGIIGAHEEAINEQL